MPYYTHTFTPMTRIFGDCFKYLTSFHHFHQWQEYLKIVSSAWYHSNIFNNDKNIWRLYQMPYYTHTFTPMTRIFGDCFKCLKWFQHFQQWQEYLKIVWNAILHSHIYTNDKNIWRLFQVPDIIPTFSTVKRIFEDCIKCFTTLRHLPQWQEYLEIVSNAWHHSNIFNNDKNIWRLYQMPYYTQTFTPMTRIIGDCFKCLTSFQHFQQLPEYLKIVPNALLHSHIYTNDKNIWRLLQVPDIIPTFPKLTRMFEDCIKCLTTLTHLHQWQEFLEDCFKCLTITSNIFNQWQEIFWRLFQVPDIIPTFSTMTWIFEDCLKCLTSFQNFNIYKNIWRLYQMLYYTQTFTPMTRIFEDCFRCMTSFQHFQQWQEYLKIVSNALLHSDIYTNDKNILRLFRVPDIIPPFSTMTRIFGDCFECLTIIPTFSTMTTIFEDCSKCLTTLRHLQQWQEYLEIVSSAWHHSTIFNNEKNIWR